MTLKNSNLIQTQLHQFSIHFNLKFHNFVNNFSFFVFKKDILDLNDRLNLESFLINLSNKLEVRLINEHLPIFKDYFPSKSFLK